jgi:hypothetical protein
MTRVRRCCVLKKGRPWKSFDWLVLILLRSEEVAIGVGQESSDPTPQPIAVGMRTSLTVSPGNGINAAAIQ